MTLRKYRITSSEFDLLCDKIDSMNKKVDYIPKKTDLENAIEKNGLKKYISYLVWIDTCAEKTSENAEDLQYIRSLLKDHLIISDDGGNAE